MSGGYEVVQQLYYVPNASVRRGKPVLVTIEKVGRKWLYLSNRERVDSESLFADGGEYMTPGRCYQSQAEYETICDANAAWWKLHQWIERTHSRPNDLSEGQIYQAARVLGIDLDKQES